MQPRLYFCVGRKRQAVQTFAEEMDHHYSRLKGGDFVRGRARRGYRRHLHHRARACDCVRIFLRVTSDERWRQADSVTSVLALRSLRKPFAHWSEAWPSQAPKSARQVTCTDMWDRLKYGMVCCGILTREGPEPPPPPPPLPPNTHTHKHANARGEATLSSCHYREIVGIRWAHPENLGVRACRNRAVVGDLANVTFVIRRLPTSTTAVKAGAPAIARHLAAPEPSMPDVVVSGGRDICTKQPVRASNIMNLLVFFSFCLR